MVIGDGRRGLGLGIRNIGFGIPQTLLGNLMLVLEGIWNKRGIWGPSWALPRHVIRGLRFTLLPVEINRVRVPIRQVTYRKNTCNSQSPVPSRGPDSETDILRWITSFLR